MILPIISLFLYLFFIILIICGLILYKKPTIRNGEREIGVSVIVAVRNGEKSLPNLLTFLSHQKYTGPFEVVVVDDKSEDNTASIIKEHATNDQRFRFETSEMGSESLKQKKRALDAGIKIAKYDNLLFTDVDCTLGPDWIENMASYFVSGYDYLVGYSYIDNKNITKFVSLFQGIDLLMMMIVGKAFFGLHKPFGAVGQNQGFTRNLYELAGGFNSIHSFIGDDTAFLQHCKKFNPKIGFVDSVGAHIQSRKETKWKNLFFQRARWASDANNMWRVSWFFFLIFFITFFINVSTLFIVTSSLINHNLVEICMIYVLCKFLLEFLVYNIGSRSLSVYPNVLHFSFWFVVQIPYVVTMGVFSFISQYFRWKGKRE